MVVRLSESRIFADDTDCADFLGLATTRSSSEPGFAGLENYQDFFRSIGFLLVLPLFCDGYLSLCLGFAQILTSPIRALYQI